MKKEVIDMWWKKREYKAWNEYKQNMESKEDILFMHTVAKESIKNSGGESWGKIPIDPQSQ